jgi:hypothetical protein
LERKTSKAHKETYRKAAKLDLLRLPRPTIVRDEVRIRLAELRIAKGRKQFTVAVVVRGK